jgi:hypothetical protein
VIVWDLAAFRAHGGRRLALGLAGAEMQTILNNPPLASHLRWAFRHHYSFGATGDHPWRR